MCSTHFNAACYCRYSITWKRLRYDTLNFLSKCRISISQRVCLTERSVGFVLFQVVSCLVVMSYDVATRVCWAAMKNLSLKAKLLGHTSEV